MSDSFACLPPVNSAELVVKIIDVRYNKDEYNEVLSRSEKLRGYSILISYVKKYQKETNDKSLAVRLAVQRCLEEGILKDFLIQNSAEVGRMLFQSISMEEFAEIRAEESYEKGCEETEERMIKTFIEFQRGQGVSKTEVKISLIEIYQYSEEKAESYINQFYHSK